MIIIDTLYAVVCCDGQHLCKIKCINTKDDKDKDCILNDVVKYNTQTLHNKYHCTIYQPTMLNLVFSFFNSGQL